MTNPTDNQPVQVVSPSGERGTVPAAALSRAVADGFRVETPEEAAQRLKEEKFGTTGQKILTGVEGAAKGITFGLSTHGQIALGADPENIKARAEVNPAEALGGEIGGGVALGLATLGLGAPAAAGSVAKTAGGTVLSRVGAAALREGATGAVVGAASGFGNVSHEAALGNPNLTAEHIAEQVGFGALMGGGLGAALGATGVVLPEAIKRSRDAIGGMYRKGKSALGQAYDAAEGVTGTQGNIANLMLEHTVEIQALERALPGVSDDIASATPEMAGWIVRNGNRLTELEAAHPGTTRALSRVDPNTAEFLVNNWRDIVTDPVARTRMTTTMRDGMQDVVSNTDDLLRKVNAELAPEAEEELLGALRHVKEPKAKAAYEALTTKIGAVADEMQNRSLGPAQQEMAKRLNQIQSNLVRDLNDVTVAEARAGKTMADDLIDSYRRLKTLRQEIGDEIKWKADLGELGPSERAAQKTLKGLYSDVRRVLTDEDVWGEAAALRAELDAVTSEWKNLTGKGSYFRGKFTEKNVHGRPEVRAEKVNTWLNGMVKGSGEERAEAWGEVVGAARRLSDVAEKHSKFARTSKFDRGGFDSLLAKAAQHSDETQRAANVTAMHKQLLSGGMGIPNSGPVSPMLGFAGRAAEMMLPGAVTSTVRMATSVPRAVRVLAAMESAGKKVSQRIDTMAAAIVNGSPRAARVGTFTGSALQPKRISELAANPAALQAELERMTDGVNEHAPDTSQAIQVGAARSVAFLASKLPPTIKTGPLGPTLEPTPGQMSAYNRCAAIVEKPTSLLDHVAAGTVTPDMVEAAEVCAPQVLAAMRTAVLDKLTEKGEAAKLPYRVRLGLQMLMGQSLDGTGTPAAIQANQAAYQRPSQRSMENQTGPQAVGPKGADKLKTASRWATPSERADQRMGGE